MASLAQDIHTWVNIQSWVPGVINFNTVRPDSADPWYLMAVTASENERMTLCESEGGVLTLTFSGFSSQRYATYDVMDQLRNDIQENLRGALTGYDVWMILSDGAVSSQSIDNQIMEYTFDINASWGKE